MFLCYLHNNPRGEVKTRDMRRRGRRRGTKEKGRGRDVMRKEGRVSGRPGRRGLKEETGMGKGKGRGEG